MDMEQLYSYVPRELVTFVLVTLFSLLIGLSQRRISLKREGLSLSPHQTAMPRHEVWASDN